ncbi:ferritin-like domain-containing protein [Sphingomonas solaris]|uniref:Ferritin-like domain-containing protein n=1 Tax=Alterirhizorhabdus solaris TaxID=2529389 RepID=A0A558R8B3_9SPHN|nr:ferritin-like domain-containing protein [Sphingomonas solaris]TVV75620.1 ferritin-like domain-containing protein [Sphingomonas solaris]
MPADTSVAAAACGVLLAADPRDKVKAARAAARAWRAGRLDWRFDVAVPDRPARGDRPELLPPSRMPKRGRAGSPRTRIAMLHAVAHIEYVAIDLAFDMVARFGGLFPRAFTDDWMTVGAEEAMHFAIVARRLRALGAAYGDLPAHDGLWAAAAATAHDPLARLAIVPMVLEARGLDVTPMMIARFEAAGDQASGRVLRRILADEVGHVAAGVRWFESLCGDRGAAVVPTWRRLVGEGFAGAVKPPFNDSSRSSAGLTRAFYDGLVDVERFTHGAFTT